MTKAQADELEQAKVRENHLKIINRVSRRSHEKYHPHTHY
jgi:hypothetical protein